MPIRRKLVITLALPLVVLAAITGVEVAQVVDEADEVREQSALATAALGPSGLVQAIQTEAEAAGVTLVGLEEVVDLPVVGLEEAWAETDRAVAEFEEVVADRGESIQATYRPALRTLEALSAVRASVEGYDRPRQLESGIELTSQLFNGYEVIVGSLIEASDWASRWIDDPVLRRGNDLITIANRQRTLTNDITWGLIFGQLGPEGFDEGEGLIALGELVGTYDAGVQRIATVGSGPYAPAARRIADSERLAQFRSLVREGMSTGPVGIGPLIQAGEARDGEDYELFRSEVADVLLDRADTLDAEARARQRWFVALASLVLVAALVTTWLVSRSITRPLRSLTVQATDLAGGRLPGAVATILDTPLGEDVRIPDVVPVTTSTRDEVADVTGALNTVQDSALDLAVEQAVLRRNIADSFINLGRRNQNLLARQIDFITELESDEADPDALAGLFRLDHLATRMRRNAESLLVLSSAEAARRWTAPVRLTDVVRSALGEVEDYKRVQMTSIAAVDVVGSVAGDLAHLLAELIENALTFSRGRAPVDVRGQLRPHGEGYTLVVIDDGCGMSAPEIDEANRRLAGAESFTVAPSQYLGHYVAGRLAARHGIGLRVDGVRDGGLMATAQLPPSLLVGIEPPEPRPVLVPPSSIA